MRELRQFVEVASRHSISAAAKHLNISQPALSRAIQKLEDSYGAPLFIRNGAGVALSPYGSALYSRAVRILPALDEAREEIEQLQGRAKAAIRIASGDLWGLAILPEVTREFAMTHPHVVVQVEITDEGSRLEGLRNDIYDLVFGTFSARYSPLVKVEFLPLVRQATFVYCDAKHPLQQRESVSLEELLAHRWVSPGYEDDAGPGILASGSRDFAIRVDTMMNALLVLGNSPFLMSASSGFTSLFKHYGLEALRTDDAGRADDSGVIFPARSMERQAVRDFLQLTKQTVSRLKLPVVV